LKIRVVFYIASLVLLCLIVFLTGLYSGSHKTLPYKVVAKIKKDVQTALNESLNLTAIKPTHWVVDKRHDGNGVTLNSSGDAASELVLLQGFFEDGIELRLIRRDGELVARWPVSYKALAGNITHLRNVPATDWNVGFHGAVLLPDGSVVFNLDHIGLFRFGRCGEMLWGVDEPTHHSVEYNADGSLWVPSAAPINKLIDTDFALFKPPYSTDTILHVSADGELLEEISLLDIHINSNEWGLLTLTGNIVPGTMAAVRIDFNRELFHLNDVEELPSHFAEAFPMFESGDLLISMRNRNLISVIDRKTLRIKWWHIGPWVRQHDPDWNPDGTITIFDNNRDGTEVGKILGSSRILSIDPATKETRILYGGAGEEFFYCERRGKHQLLENGSMLIVEAEAGRVFQIDREGKITWEYINHYSKSQNARITDARVYKMDYFIEDDWNCSEQ
jgi:arylsulfotransferase ASST